MRTRAVHLDSLVNEVWPTPIAVVPKQSWKVNLIGGVVVVFLKDPLQRSYYLKMIPRLLCFQDACVE